MAQWGPTMHGQPRREWGRVWRVVGVVLLVLLVGGALVTCEAIKHNPPANPAPGHSVIEG